MVRPVYGLQGFGIFICIICIARPTHSIDERGVSDKTITIGWPSLSPAYAAAEDCFKSIETDELEVEDLNRVSLNSGPEADFWNTELMMDLIPQPLEKVPKDKDTAIRKKTTQTVATNFDMGSPSSRLKGLTIRTKPLIKDGFNNDLIISKIEPSIVSEKATPQRGSSFSGNRLISKAQTLFLAQPGSDISPSISEISIGEKKVEKSPIKLSEETPINPTISNLFSSQSSDPNSQNISDYSQKNPVVLGEKNISRSKNTSKNTTVAQIDKSDTSLSSERTKFFTSSVLSSRQVNLSGDIEMVGGLAITDARDHIVIYRSKNGVFYEKAKVWLEEGRFDLRVQSMEGQIVALLKNSDEEIIGREEIQINKLSVPDNTDRLENLKIKLKPVVYGVQVEVSSANSYGGQKIPVPHAKVWLDETTTQLQKRANGTTYHEEGVATHSHFVLRAEAENHWGTLLVGFAGESLETQLFPNQMMDALFNIIEKEKKSHSILKYQKQGVVWGRVTKDGKTVSGAKLEIAGDGNMTPIYFNSLILPDFQTEATGENGIFAFIGVVPGIQSVRVFYQGKSFPAQVVPVEENHVSYLNFEVQDPELLPFELFDPFDKNLELSARVRLLGLESDPLDIQREGHLPLSRAGTGLGMIEVDAGHQYEMSRYVVSHKNNFVYLPVIRRDWISIVLSRRRINLSSDKGTVVGFVKGDDFTVNLDRSWRGDTKMAPNQSPEIVYFDAAGNVLFGEEGVSGGGFIIFNVPTGMSGLLLATKSSPELEHQTFVSETGVTNVIYFDKK